MIVDGESLGFEMNTGLLGNSRTNGEFRSTGFICANAGEADGTKFAAPSLTAPDGMLVPVGR